MTVRGMLVAVLCAVTGCVAPGSASPMDTAWTYDVAVSPALDRLDVVMRIEDDVTAVALGDDDGLPFVSVPLARAGRTFTCGGATEIRYSVDLAAMAAGGGRRSETRRIGRDLRTSPGLWLLRPVPTPRDADATLRFRMPDGVHVSVPWAPDGDGWRVDASTFRIRGRMAFTHEPPRRMDVGGAVLSVALLDGARKLSPDDAARVMVDTAGAVASLHGGFPVPRAQGLLEPSSNGNGVGFGMALRGGGRCVHLHLGRDITAERLARDWTPVHEMIHLGMPWLEEPDAWMGEGWVTYHTELLLGRGGRREERETWQELWEGFERGRRGTGARTLSEHSRQMHATHAYMAVYWGGAATALALDVELRRSSEGRLSFDDAVRELWRLHRNDRDVVSAEQCLAELDRWLGRPLFTETCGRMLARPATEGAREFMAELGVRVVAGRVELDVTAPLAELRKSITR